MSLFFSWFSTIGHCFRRSRLRALLLLLLRLFLHIQLDLGFYDFFQQVLRLLFPASFFHGKGPGTFGTNDHTAAVKLTSFLGVQVIGTKAFGNLELFVSEVKIPRATKRISYVDVHRMSFPVYTSTPGLSSNEWQYFLVGCSGFFLFSLGSKGVSMLEQCRSFAQIRYTEWEQLERCWVGQTRGGRVPLIFRVENGVIFRLNGNLVSIPETVASDLDCFLCASERRRCSHLS
mmetsp:Transcript_24480/g.41610  ORF Transcript_24480/g.41610 Transcript_24480/m.41610 type:complete len:232 (+) Transcript_24480:230-925(+)